MTAHNVIFILLSCILVACSVNDEAPPREVDCVSSLVIHGHSIRYCNQSDGKLIVIDTTPYAVAIPRSRTDGSNVLLLPPPDGKSIVGSLFFPWFPVWDTMFCRIDPAVGLQYAVFHYSDDEVPLVLDTFWLTLRTYFLDSLGNWIPDSSDRQAYFQIEKLRRHKGNSIAFNALHLQRIRADSAMFPCIGCERSQMGIRTIPQKDGSTMYVSSFMCSWSSDTVVLDATGRIRRAVVWRDGKMNEKTYP